VPGQPVTKQGPGARWRAFGLEWWSASAQVASGQCCEGRQRSSTSPAERGRDHGFSF